MPYRHGNLRVALTRKSGTNLNMVIAFHDHGPEGAYMDVGGRAKLPHPAHAPYLRPCRQRRSSCRGEIHGRCARMHKCHGKQDVVSDCVEYSRRRPDLNHLK